MFASQRQEQILLQLKQNGKVLVKELSQTFNVTPDCIRKDLALLEKQNLLNRVYGGAIEPRTNTHLTQVKNRKNIDIKEKQEIAQKAIECIKENEMIFLDISTINLEIARCLLASSFSNITVVSNMVGILNLFSETPHTIPFIFIGGFLNAEGDGFYGSLNIEMLQKFQFDRTFIGCVGLNTQNNSVFTFSVSDGLTKTYLMAQSKRNHLVAENQKFSQDGNFEFAKIDDFSDIISSPALPIKCKEALQKLNISFII